MHSLSNLLLLLHFITDKFGWWSGTLSQVCLGGVGGGGHADRDGLELGAHAEELAGHAHQRHRDTVQHPPEINYESI